MQSQPLMSSSLILSEDNKNNDDESSGSDSEMHQLGGTMHLRYVNTAYSPISVN